MIIKTNIWSIPHTQKTPTIPKSQLLRKTSIIAACWPQPHTHTHSSNWPTSSPPPRRGRRVMSFFYALFGRCVTKQFAVYRTLHAPWLVALFRRRNQIAVESNRSSTFFCLVVFWRDRNPKVDVVLCTDVPRQRELHLLYLHKRNPKRFAEENAPHITSKKSGKTTKKYAKLHERSLIFLFFPVERSRRKTRFRWLNRFSTFPFCSCLRRASAEECLQTDHHSLTTPLCEAEPCVENQNRSNSGMQQRELFRKQK